MYGYYYYYYYHYCFYYDCYLLQLWDKDLLKPDDKLGRYYDTATTIALQTTVLHSTIAANATTTHSP